MNFLKMIEKAKLVCKGKVAGLIRCRWLLEWLFSWKVWNSWRENGVNGTVVQQLWDRVKLW